MSDILNKQSINSFYQTAIQRDFARKHLFRVLSFSLYANDPSVGAQTPLPPSLSQKDLVYMTTATLPSRKISVVDAPYAGLKFHVPGGSVEYTNSEGWDIKFRLPMNHRIRSIFEGWTRVTFDEKTTTGDYGIPGAHSMIKTVLLDNKGNAVKYYEFYGCFVIDTGNVEYDLSAEKGDILDFTVKVAYQYFQELPGDGVNFGATFGVTLPGIGSIAGAANNNGGGLGANLGGLNF
jgi:hypothetical protein